MNDLDPTEEIENDDVTICGEEYIRLKRAKELLDTVYDDYLNFGEVLQDVTIEEMEEFFEGLEESEED